MKPRPLAKYTLIAASLTVLMIPAVTHALSFENTGATLTLGTADLKQTVVNLLNLVLGLLALIAVIMVIIGGFTWMTAGGNEERVDKAKKIISSAVIGMIIVILSWALVSYIAGTTKNVSGA